MVVVVVVVGGVVGVVVVAVVAVAAREALTAHHFWAFARLSVRGLEHLRSEIQASTAANLNSSASFNIRLGKHPSLPP